MKFGVSVLMVARVAGASIRVRFLQDDVSVLAAPLIQAWQGQDPLADHKTVAGTLQQKPQ